MLKTLTNEAESKEQNKRKQKSWSRKQWEQQEVQEDSLSQNNGKWKNHNTSMLLQKMRNRL